MLVLVAVVGLAALSGVAAADAPTCTGTDADFDGGNGTEGDEYEIANVSHLQCMNQTAHLGANVTLTDDVNASDTENWNGGDGFAPVGNSSTSFTGSFDGQGYTVSDLTVNRSTEDFVGLFGFVDGGSIANVTLANVSVDGNDDVGGLVGENLGGTVSTSSATGTVTGNNTRVGGLVGLNNNGIVTSSYATGSVSGDQEVGGLVGQNYVGSVTEDSYSTGTVSGDDEVGGLTGDNHGTVTNSSASGTVTGSGDVVGGLVGWNFAGAGSVTNSYATGAVSGDFRVGGLVGDNGESVTKSFATGTVTSTGFSVGGLVGLNDGTVATSYATGDVSGDSSVGGLVGSIPLQSPGASVTNSYATGNVAGNGTFGGLIGDDPDESATNSYWDATTTNQMSSAGGAGAIDHPTANLTGAAAPTNMTGFDFTSNWTTTDAYPHLRWAVDDLALDLDSTTIDEGDTTQATVTLSLAQNTTVTASTVANYTSNDTSVATTGSPVITAQGTGSTDITAEHAGHADALALSVQSAGGGSGSPVDLPTQPTDCGPSTGLEDVDVSVSLDAAVVCVEIAFDTDDPGSVTVEPVDALPAGTDPLPDTTGLAFVDVTVPSGLADSEATMQFTLDADVLGEVDPAELAIYRYADGEWTALETSVVPTDGDVVVEAEPPGFSLFAVGTAPQQDTPESTTPDGPTPDDDPTPTPADETPTPEPATPAPDPGTPTPDDEESTGFGTLPLVVLVILAAIAIGAYAYTRRQP